MPAALDGKSESGFHRRRGWCGIEFSMLLFIPQNYRSNAAVRCIGHRSVLQRLMQCTALDIAAHCVFLFILYTESSQWPSPFLFTGYTGVQRRVAAAHQRLDLLQPGSLVGRSTLAPRGTKPIGPPLACLHIALDAHCIALDALLCVPFILYVSCLAVTFGIDGSHINLEVVALGRIGRVAIGHKVRSQRER